MGNKDLPLRLKKFTIIIPLAIFLILLVFSVDLSLSNRLLKKQIQSIKVDLEQKETDLAVRDEEIRLCIEDRGKFGETSIKTYSYSEFGIYSPLFEDREVGLENFEYKRNRIVRKSLGFKEESESLRWGISVWELEEFTHNLPQLEGYAAVGTQFDFPIFDGYENYGPSPRWISERMSSWKNTESLYVNQNNINMHWRLEYAPKSIGSVCLEFYNPNSPSGNQAFVVLCVGLKGDLFVTEESDLSVTAAKKYLMEIADTIDLRYRK